MYRDHCIGYASGTRRGTHQVTTLPDQLGEGGFGAHAHMNIKDLVKGRQSNVVRRASSDTRCADRNLDRWSLYTARCKLEPQIWERCSPLFTELFA